MKNKLIRNIFEASFSSKCHIYGVSCVCIIQLYDTVYSSNALCNRMMVF